MSLFCSVQSFQWANLPLARPNLHEKEEEKKWYFIINTGERDICIVTVQYSTCKVSFKYFTLLNA